jgi:hypothetical protein
LTVVESKNCCRKKIKNTEMLRKKEIELAAFRGVYGLICPKLSQKISIPRSLLALEFIGCLLG